MNTCVNFKVDIISGFDGMGSRQTGGRDRGFDLTNSRKSGKWPSF